MTLAQSLIIKYNEVFVHVIRIQRVAVLNYSIITVGHGRNEAILQSRGEYLCFLDAVRS